MAPYFVQDRELETELIFRASDLWLPVMITVIVSACFLFLLIFTLTLCGCCCGNEKERRAQQEKIDAGIAPPPVPTSIISARSPSTKTPPKKSRPAPTGSDDHQTVVWSGHGGGGGPPKRKSPSPLAGPAGPATMAFADSKVFDKRKMASDASLWSVIEVQKWLRDIGFEKYCGFFLDNNMDGESLLSLETVHLVCLVKIFGTDFALKDVLKFEQCLKQLKASPSDDNRLVLDAQCSFGQENVPIASAGPVSNEANWRSGGFEENVRYMEQLYPENCWRYKSAEVILKDYIPSQNAANDGGTIEKTFLATASHVISPVDFYVQPAFMQATLKKMQQLLQTVYSEKTCAVPRENVFVGMPCVARSKQDDNWYRAQVVDVVGTNEAPVRFVDWGHRQYSPLDDLKPLLTEFGRYPPAALPCRIKGVRERTLEQKVLDAFHADINGLGCEIRVKIVSSSLDPLLVEIFNQYTNENIGVKYLPKEPICPKLPSIQAWKKNKEREQAAMNAATAQENATGADEVKLFASDMDAFMEGAFLGYSSSDDGQTGPIKRTNKKLRKIKHEETMLAQKKASSKPEEEARIISLPPLGISIQRRYPKQRKPLSGMLDVRIAHVESTNEIYLHILAFGDDIGIIQGALAELYEGLDSLVPDLPQDFTVLDNACVVYSKDDQAWYRCRLAEMNFNAIIVQAVDVGNRMAPIPPSEIGRMKALLAEPTLDVPPKAFYCRIDQLCENAPTMTESRILKELLPRGTVMKAEFDRNREPWKVTLLDADTKRNFSEYFIQELEKRGLQETIASERRPCKEVTVWRKPAILQVNEPAILQVNEPAFVQINELKAEEKQTSINEAPVKDKQQRMSSSYIPNRPAYFSPAVPVAQNIVKNVEKKKPLAKHGYDNDIEAVLRGSAAIANDSEDDSCKGSFGGKNGQTRPSEVEDDENDEKASVCCFPEEKKQYVSKWLEESNKEKDVSTASNIPSISAPKKLSAAALYNPDLARKPIGQRSMDGKAKSEKNAPTGPRSFDGRVKSEAMKPVVKPSQSSQGDQKEDHGNQPVGRVIQDIGQTTSQVIQHIGQTTSQLSQENQGSCQGNSQIGQTSQENQQLVNGNKQLGERSQEKQELGQEKQEIAQGMQKTGQGMQEVGQGVQGTGRRHQQLVSGSQRMDEGSIQQPNETSVNTSSEQGGTKPAKPRMPMHFSEVRQSFAYGAAQNP